MACVKGLPLADWAFAGGKTSFGLNKTSAFGTCFVFAVFTQITYIQTSFNCICICKGHPSFCPNNK